MAGQHRAAVRDVLGFYKQLYDGGLEDKDLQQAAKGRDESFAAFAEGKVGILARGRLLLALGDQPDKDGDATDGRPRQRRRLGAHPGAGRPAPASGAQDFVSHVGRRRATSSTPTRSIPQQAWELLQFIGSADAMQGRASQGAARITARQDVNDEVLAKDPLLSFVSEKVLPITHYRPGSGGLPAGVPGAAAGHGRRRLGQERRPRRPRPTRRLWRRRWAGPTR